MKVLLLIVCLAIGETTAVNLKRSVGGTSLGIEDAPFFVSIKQRGHHVCGGALITTKHVITAAYCLVDKSGNERHHLEVVSGTASKYDGGTLHKIRHLFIAPGFGLEGFRNDIAVLVLSEHVKSDAKQYPIALPTAELRRRGKAKFIAFASTDNPLENSLLHQLNIQIHPIDFCPGIPPIEELIYSADKFCGISDYYERTYTGDFGGPLVRNGTVVGILSFIKAPDTLYNYFMDVNKFTDLIDESKKCLTSLCNSEAARYILYSST